VERASESALGVIGPTPEGGRIGALDVLRGVAVLGILPMNVPTFALTYYAITYPPLLGGLEGSNLWVWAAGHIVFELKMMAIFSMLFGAGVALWCDRIEGKMAGIMYYRRMGWLALIGALHGHLLWYGDILVSYAVCGMLVYPLRRLSAGRLALIGAALLLVPAGVNVSIGIEAASRRAAAEGAVAQGAEAEGQRREGIIAAWDEMRGGFVPSAEALAAEREAALGGYGGYLAMNSRRAAFMETGVLALWSLWRVSGLTLIGIALLRLGVLTAERSARFYRGLAIVGIGVGAAAVGVGVWLRVAHGHDFVAEYLFDGHLNYFGSVAMALGYVGVVMLIVKSGAWRSAQGALAKVGRMALTNYLVQSALCALVFAGWGLGMWGRMSRGEQWVVVTAVWALEVGLSAAWLRWRRIGPAEWVWRRLAYGNG